MTADRAGSERRVALLARPGVASDRLRDMLVEAGIERVLHADPTQLNVPDLIAAEPDVVVIALDAVTEDVLDRFDAVLGDPAIDVIYEEADLTATREGWDAARWKRHLIAKLQRHGDVLPPGTEPDFSRATEAVSSGGYSAFDPVMAEASGATLADSSLFADFSSDWAEDDNTQMPQVEVIEFDAAFNPALAEATREAYPGLDDGHAGGDAAAFDGDEIRFEEDESPPAAPPVVVTLDRPFAADDMSLVDDPSGVSSTHGAKVLESFHEEIADLERRISTMELVDDTPVQGPRQARGAVLVMAGIGGPDAVRQLLGALPVDFSRPVLVQQRLDGGRYDKLVAQMQRATGLPVRLAEPGQIAIAGHVYILPAELRISANIDGVRFNDSGDDALSTLPSADSAILLLSGSDPADVDVAMKHGCAGALVAGQAPDGCYDPAAPTELAARGGDTAQPVELAQRLVERWPA
ncbi:MAG: chemotaxis protein [Pseudomonadota bacterium]|nr:chemotaxis protein [Pseudomonadota bacterium]